MRAKIDDFLRRRLCSMVAPPALSVGPALATGCNAHVPERPACTVHDVEDDTESAAREIAAALEGCELPALKAAILSHAELSSISRTPPDLPAYEEMVTRWLSTRSFAECTPSQTTTPFERTGTHMRSDVTLVDLDGRWRVLVR
jgi:hypothetical protein